VWWSPDSRALHYTNADRTNVWRQSLNGGAPTEVTGLADSMITRGDLSPDGHSLLAVRVNPIRDAFLITGFRKGVTGAASRSPAEISQTNVHVDRQPRPTSRDLGNRSRTLSSDRAVQWRERSSQAFEFAWQ
jgi:hypothetical protein